MGAYFQITLKSFQKAVAYKAEAWMQLLGNLTFLLLYVSVWGALLKGGERGDLPTMLAYIMAVQLVNNLNLRNMAWELPEKIRKGDIAVDMLKPLYLPLRYTAEQEGQSLFALVRAIPVYLLIGWAMKIELPDAATLGWFLLSTFLGHYLFTAILLTVLSLSFWIQQTHAIYDLVDFGYTVFAGTLIPLWYLPPFMAKVASYLPFQAVFYTPGAIFAGELTGPALQQALLVQVAWLFVGLLAVHFSWSAATKKVVAQGG